ncbi:MAG: TerB family tellurite resistance protein [Alphaproteobacteria bacterium]|nr:TerB family tellurite resistance protein [Alphaproteobacteria bacterium]
MAWDAIIKRIGLGSEGAWRSGLGRLAELFNPFGWLAPKPPSKQLAFTMAFVGLAAKMAKADGVAVEVETQAFERCFYVPPEERANVLRVFELASRDIAGYEIYAERIARLLQDEPALLRDVFECLFNIAAADGVLHHGEEEFLRKVAEKFAFTDADYRRVRSHFVNDPDSPYLVLGLEPDVSDDELNARRMQLIRENHPDRLAAEGVPQEFLVLADRKLAAINAAYDAIVKERGLGAKEIAGG